MMSQKLLLIRPISTVSSSSTFCLEHSLHQHYLAYELSLTMIIISLSSTFRHALD